jgi:hypothetical protein
MRIVVARHGGSPSFKSNISCLLSYRYILDVIPSKAGGLAKPILNDIA